MLLSASHEVDVRDLLAEPWTEMRLRRFFGNRPAAEWLNRSAVRVKSGEIVPEALSAQEAMALLLADPALIRRPLMEAAGERCAGWEPERIEAWIGLGTAISPGKEGVPAGGRGRLTPRLSRLLRFLIRWLRKPYEMISSTSRHDADILRNQNASQLNNLLGIYFPRSQNMLLVAH